MVGRTQSALSSAWADFSCRDAWAKHSDLDSYEAKWLYVEALLKVLALIAVNQAASLT